MDFVRERDFFLLYNNNKKRRHTYFLKEFVWKEKIKNKSTVPKVYLI